MRISRGIILGVLLGIFLLPGCARREKAGADLPRIPVFLNSSLTNEMSDIRELKPLDDSILAFLDKWRINGVSLAITRGDSLVYAKGYGWADVEKKTEMRPDMTLRVASVSKLITAVGIMTLQEKGMLSLDDKVFGKGGILTQFNGCYTDRRYEQITVRHLLRHEGGFTCKVYDPLFYTVKLMKRYGFDRTPTGDQIIRIELGRPLEFTPGTESEYSNLGYLLLVRIIEKVTGEDYETWMQRNVLRPAGCFDMHLGRNWYADRLPSEPHYYPYKGDKPADSIAGDGEKVSRPYGGNDIETLSGAGAWVASTPELARLVASIDGGGPVQDILSRMSVDEMTAEVDSLTFPMGWINSDEHGVWWRTGTLSGTSALIQHFPDGECWIMVTNTSSNKGSRFTREIAALFEKSREEFSPLLPKRDLFHY